MKMISTSILLGLITLLCVEAVTPQKKPPASTDWTAPGAGGQDWVLPPGALPANPVHHPSGSVPVNLPHLPAGSAGAIEITNLPHDHPFPVIDKHGGALGDPAGLPPGAVPAGNPVPHHPTPGEAPHDFHEIHVGLGPRRSERQFFKHKRPNSNYADCNIRSYDDEEQWVCPETEYFQVDEDFLWWRLESDFDANQEKMYPIFAHTADTSTCHKGWKEKADRGFNPVFTYSNLCKTTRREIQYVYDYFLHENAWHRDVCVVFPGQWLFSVSCSHPDYNPKRNAYGNLCKTSYGAAAKNFHCLPNAFVDRKVVVWCKNQYAFKWFEKRVATTCSCQKCPNACMAKTIKGLKEMYAV